MTKEDKIPLYTSVGIKVTVILMLLLGLMIIKNCASSIYYGTITDDGAIQQYYEMGYTAGEQQALSKVSGNNPQIDNPLLQKAFQRGFRQGWDAQQPGKTIEQKAAREQQQTP